jgi:hypothetical protein
MSTSSLPASAAGPFSQELLHTPVARHSIQFMSFMHLCKLSLSCLQTSRKDHCNTAPVTRTYELFSGAASSRSLSLREGDILERSQCRAGVLGILERRTVQDKEVERETGKEHQATCCQANLRCCAGGPDHDERAQNTSG